MDNFIIGKKTDEQDHYFVNISDGEPYYELRSGNPKYHSGFSYTDDVAVAHTKRQVEKIRAQGVRILSYFINTNNTMFGICGGALTAPTSLSRKDVLRRQFEMMYGKNAQFIDVTNVFDIAKTMNRLFLSGE
jgi:phosphoribosylformylglycinamidine (FGAM) synthase-like amidotransferase family enzyme